jgi:hypothetical protein
MLNVKITLPGASSRKSRHAGSPRETAGAGLARAIRAQYASIAAADAESACLRARHEYSARQ